MRLPDFSGWATKNNLKCADGLVIKQGAFSVNEGQRVPLVWNHRHDDPTNVLGHAILTNKPEGVWADCYFNDTKKSLETKKILQHGDIVSLSIWANNLSKNGYDVEHGVIREVSLVLAGANPGAFIESVMAHGISIDEEEDEGILYSGSDIYFAHADENEEKEDDNVGDDERTVADVIDEMTDEQKAAVAILVGQALEDGKNEDEDEEEDDEMRHNIFDPNEYEGDGDSGYLAHGIDMERLLDDAKRIGSFRDALRDFDDGELYHALTTTGMEVATGTQTYGFNDPSMLFPDFKSLNTPPEWISRNMDWVSKVMNGVHHTPFSRIKSVYADITEDEARARGYIKGKQKKEEVFTTLKRTTTPQTIYKLQKMDRDDIIDITEFDVIAWIRAEMRVMLNEEIARAILIGDGRPSDSDYKINEQNIRPVAKDVPLFNIVIQVTDADDDANNIIEAVLRGRKNYKGSGTPTFFTTEDVLTEMLLLKDGIGHRLYKTETELATALRVKEIVTVEPMEGQKVTVGTSDLSLIGIIVNLADYNVGADKGGEISNFDDFDIKFNQYLYLIETRISGALVKPFSAMTIVKAAKATGGSGGTQTPPTGGGTD